MRGGPQMTRTGTHQPRDDDDTRLAKAESGLEFLDFGQSRSFRVNPGRKRKRKRKLRDSVTA